MPLVSVIVPARNEEGHIGRTLEALLYEHLFGISRYGRRRCQHRPRPSAAALFAARGPVRVLRNRRSLGPMRSTNLASRRTDARCLFFIDGDCTPAPDWIEQGVRRSRTRRLCRRGRALLRQPQAGVSPSRADQSLLQPGAARSLTVPGSDYANGNFASAVTLRRRRRLQRAPLPCGREDTDLGLRLRRPRPHRPQPGDDRSPTRRNTGRFAICCATRAVTRPTSASSRTTAISHSAAAASSIRAFWPSCACRADRAPLSRCARPPTCSSCRSFYAYLLRSASPSGAPPCASASLVV